MTAATELFVTQRGGRPLLQFEDFNSNDAFPLLETYRNKFLTYNDDIQGTAAVAVAGLCGAIKIRAGAGASIAEELRRGVYLFHGAGSANLGAAALLTHEAGVPMESIFMTNSRGIIWRSDDGTNGSFRNGEQKEFAQVGLPTHPHPSSSLIIAHHRPSSPLIIPILHHRYAQVGQPTFDSTDLVQCVRHIRPTCLIGAVGVAPGCFTRQVRERSGRAPQTHDTAPLSDL